MPDLEAPSCAQLASWCGVNPRRISAWRSIGAPRHLQLAPWLTWLRSARKRGAAARLDEAIAALSDPLAPGETDPADTPADQPPAGEPVQIDWKNREMRARALRAEAELAEREGRLVPRDQIVAMVRSQAARVSELIGAGIWSDLLPHLAHLEPATRRALRDAHDRSVLRLRQQILASGPAALARLPAQGPVHAG